MKMKNLLAILPIVLAATTGVAVAETEISLGYETFRQDWASDGVDYNGAKSTISGRYDSGFRYDLNLYSGEFNLDSGRNVSSDEVDLELGYLFNDRIGPSFVYYRADQDGRLYISRLAGIIGKYVIGATTLEGQVLSDLEDFGNDWSLSFETNHTLSPQLALYTESYHQQANGTNFSSFSAGLQRDFASGAFVKGEAVYGKGEYADGENFDLNGFEIALGYKF